MIAKLQDTQSCAGSERVEVAGAGRCSVYLLYWYKKYEYIYELQSHAGSESVEEAAGAGRRCFSLLALLVQKARSYLLYWRRACGHAEGRVCCARMTQHVNALSVS
jgi:hypothetical protein